MFETEVSALLISAGDVAAFSCEQKLRRVADAQTAWLTRDRARQRALHAILVEEEHAILLPRPPGDHEHELALTPRMERVRHPNGSLSNRAIERS